jgi:hypothetical protein
MVAPTEASMRAKILLGIAIVVVLFVAIVATRPAAYHVERKLEVAAPADLVFGVLDDLHQFAGVWVVFGAPWATSDQTMQKTFAGPAAGVGQSVAWSGEEAGEGTLTITESVSGQRVGMKLQFVEPMASTATYAFTLASAPAGTLVTWSMDGSPNFVGKAAGLFMDMDGMLGADIKQGLALLKTAAEGKRSQ